MAKKRTPKHDIRPDVAEAIENLWPEGVVDFAPVFDSEESYFYDVEGKLGRALRKVSGGKLLFERSAEPEPDSGGWDDEDDEYPPEPNRGDENRSYHLYFLSPPGKEFEHTREIEIADYDNYYEDLNEEFDEDAAQEFWENNPPERLVSGRAWTGWTVAVSCLAPYAVITLGEYAEYDECPPDEPEIEPGVFNESGEQVDLEEDFRRRKGGKPYAALVKLRERIVAALEKNGISVLPREEWTKPVPGLTTMAEEQARVLDALFYEDYL